MKEVVTWIFAGGEIQEDFLEHYLKTNRADTIIAADAGLAAVDQFQLPVQYLVGDFDSIHQKLLEKYLSNPKIQVRKFQPEKDLTDSQIAVELALEIGSTQIVLFGCTGNRLDHLLGNLHLLYMAEQKGVVCEMLDKYNRIRILKPGVDYILNQKTLFGKYVSLIPFTDRVEGLTLYGFRYPLTDFTLTRFENPTLGISNELAKEKGRIRFLKGELICIEIGLPQSHQL